MSKLAEACVLSFNDWIATFPEEMPKAECSKEHIRWRKKLFDKMRNGYYHRFTSKTVKIILVAAILTALLLSAFAFPSSRETIVDNFDIFSTYKITKDNNNYVNNEIKVGYIPEGYVLESNESIGKNVLYKYVNENGDYLTILKHSSSYKVEFNTEKVETKEIVVDGIKYVYCSSNKGINSIIWSKNDYVYHIDSSLDYEILKNIAQSIN